MMKKTILSSLAIASMLHATAQSKDDKKYVEDLCGCFEVTFNYAETFTKDTSKKFYAKPLDNHAVIEYVFPVENTDKKMVMQHVLVVSDQMMIKHWREDWTYENNTIWSYDHDNRWVRKELNPADVKGTWTQTVWEVSDAPRYQGASQWVKANNQVFWLNTADAPLPRREYTTRRDYNVMNRTNRLILNKNGYMHEQDNIKIIRKGGAQDEILAYEKGYNNYVRVDESKCAKAKEFWAKKQDYWNDVRMYWEQLMGTSNSIQLENRVDGKLLHEALDELEGKNLAGAERKKEIAALINKFAKASK